MKNVSVLIMAGGKSERMCSPKPFLLIEGKTFIEKITEKYLLFGAKNIFIVLNQQLVRKFSVKINSLKVIPNPYPEYGRFFSLHTGLTQLPDNNFVFIHNVDNPFVEQNVLKEMWNKRSENGFVVPVYEDNGGHPILISPKIIKHIMSIKSASQTLRNVLRQYNRIEIETDSEKILTNINTWAEYEKQVLNLMPEYYGD